MVFSAILEDTMMKEFIKDEIREIEKHKWIESEKAKKDLGRQAVEDWINKHAESFRNEWLTKRITNLN